MRQIVYIMLAFLCVIALSIATYFILKNFSDQVKIPSQKDPKDVHSYYSDLGAKTVTLAGFTLTIVGLFFGIVNLLIYHRSATIADRAERMLNEESEKLRSYVGNCLQRIESLAGRAEQSVYRAYDEAGASRKEIREVTDRAQREVRDLTEQIRNEVRVFQTWRDRIESACSTTDIMIRRFNLEKVTADATFDELEAKIGELRSTLEKLSLTGDVKIFASNIVDLEDVWLSVWAAHALTSTDPSMRSKVIFRLGTTARELLRQIKEAGVFDRDSGDAIAIDEALGEESR